MSQNTSSSLDSRQSMETDWLRQCAITYAKTVHPYLGLSICIISLALNCLNCIILLRKQIIATGNTLLIHLAICDIVKTIAVIPTLIIFYVVYTPGEKSIGRQSFSIQLLRLVMDDIALTGHTASLWLAMLLALQRLICTRSRVSIQNNRWLRESTTRLMIFGVYAFVIVLMQPTYWGFYLKSINQPLSISSRSPRFGFGNNTDVANSTSSPVSVSVSVSIAAQPYYITSFRPGFGQIVHWFFAVGYKIVPCFLLTGFTIALIRTLFNSMMQHEKLLSSQSKRQPLMEDRVAGSDTDPAFTKNQHSSAGNRRRNHTASTKLLITIVILMILTQLPPAIVVLSAQDTYKDLADFFDLLSLINNATNFPLYCKMSAAFRAEFVSLILCRVGIKKRP